MNIPFLLNCKQATLFADRYHSKELGVLNYFRLSLHLKICKSCSNYFRQSLLMNEQFSDYFQHLEKSPHLILNAEDKEKLLTNLHQKLNSNPDNE